MHGTNMKFFYVILTVYLSIILATGQLNAQILYFMTSLLYSSTCFEHYWAYHQEAKLYYPASGIVTLKQVSGLKLLKYSLYKYEHIIVKGIYEFFGCNYCIFLHYKHVVSCRDYVYPVVKLIRKVLCLFMLCTC
jgi:hypothetical protein